jgi:GxxExxY protein
MPIHCPITIKRLSPAEFEEVDYRVMGHAYSSQNDLGRLCDECAHHADLKARLIADGFRSVLTEVPITVSYLDFSKQYFLDLVVDDALYELKTDARFCSEHEAQLFNYMFLLGIPRAKLLNFRPPKVQGKLIATSLTNEARRQVNSVEDRWRELTPGCSKLSQTFVNLLNDWGAFLEIGLYEEALVHLLGGQTKIEQRTGLHRNEIPLGSQRMFLHSPGVAFRLTAVTEGQQHVESHLRRLLALTNLNAIQWINLNHTWIEFTTIAQKTTTERTKGIPTAASNSPAVHSPAVHSPAVNRSPDHA